jgi:hypothetical protein
MKDATCFQRNLRIILTRFLPAGKTTLLSCILTDTPEQGTCR